MRLHHHIIFVFTFCSIPLIGMTLHNNKAEPIIKIEKQDTTILIHKIPRNELSVLCHHNENGIFHRALRIVGLTDDYTLLLFLTHPEAWYNYLEIIWKKQHNA